MSRRGAIVGGFVVGGLIIWTFILALGIILDLKEIVAK